MTSNLSTHIQPTALSLDNDLPTLRKISNLSSPKMDRNFRYSETTENNNNTASNKSYRRSVSTKSNNTNIDKRQLTLFQKCLYTAVICYSSLSYVSLQLQFNQLN